MQLRQQITPDFNRPLNHIEAGLSFLLNGLTSASNSEDIPGAGLENYEQLCSCESKSKSMPPKLPWLL
jgi:hypothetical protein